MLMSCGHAKFDIRDIQKGGEFERRISGCSPPNPSVPCVSLDRETRSMPGKAASSEQDIVKPWKRE